MERETAQTMSLMDFDPVPDPLELFREWHDEARRCLEIAEPDAMTLATVDEQGTPWARVVLVKEASERGFTFYTNLQSRKAVQVSQNPRAALCFYWMPLNKQVRIRGVAELVSDVEADDYFAGRPRESQLGAWASAQSAPLESRGELFRRVQEEASRFGEGVISRPPFWSGFRVVPTAIEFWQRQEFRLHDRLLYERNPAGGWTHQFLYP